MLFSYFARETAHVCNEFPICVNCGQPTGNKSHVCGQDWAW